jgi:hypothetical protein
VFEERARAGTSEVKGLWFAALQQYLRDAHGQAQLERIIRAMPDAHRAALAAPLPSSWYPEEALQSALSAVYTCAARGDEGSFVRMIEGCTEHGISRFFRVFLRITSPVFVLKQVPTLWKHVRRGGGQVEVLVDDGTVTVSYSEFPYFADRLYQLLTEGMLRALVHVASKRAAEVSIADKGLDWLKVRIVFSSDR